MSTKQQLRRQLRLTRQSTPSTKRVTKSLAICEQLKKCTDWSRVDTLHYFEAIENLNEVDISPFVGYIRTAYPHIQLYTFRLVDHNWLTLSLNEGRTTTPITFNSIIVPMLGFDGSLHRIGYGGGYYDTFLAAHPQAQKIGVCFELCKLQDIPTEPHDIALDSIVTELKIYSTR